MITTLHGDCRERLADLPERSVQCVATSPPYYGLRKYSDDEREIGQEATPAAYVAALVEVFSGVRRVLRDDGVVWLNLGDSYAGGKMGRSDYGTGDQTSTLGPSRNGLPNNNNPGYAIARDVPPGFKPKDLLGIPWMVARALQEPYYTGRIAREIDRVWLAAMIDAEGSICGFTHDRKDDGRTRTGVHVQITNSSTALLDKANAIWAASRSEHGRPGDGHLGLAETWRWIAHGAGNKAQLMRELYPYLVVKQKQALIAYNVFMLIVDAKRLMHTSRAQEVREKRAWAMSALSRLNHGEHVDIPTWCVEPPSMHEPGWYLRSDIIWSKPNCMPESVTDRPTRSHEYVFLLTKNPRYFYDAAAVAEPATNGERFHGAYDKPGITRPTAQRNGRSDAENTTTTRNRRTVWSIATQPYSGAHYATMPEALIEPCILAGSSARACEHCGAAWVRVVEKGPEKEGIERGKHPSAWRANMQSPQRSANGGLGTRDITTLGFAPGCACTDNTGSAASVVLDPFAGSGTVCRVAARFQRNAIGIELNQAYIDEHIEKRTNGAQIEMFV